MSHIVRLNVCSFTYCPTPPRLLLLPIGRPFETCSNVKSGATTSAIEPIYQALPPHKTNCRPQNPCLLVVFNRITLEEGKKARAMTTLDDARVIPAFKNSLIGDAKWTENSARDSMIKIRPLPGF